MDLKAVVTVGAATVFLCYDSDDVKNASNEQCNKSLHEMACHKEKQSHCRKYEAKNGDYLSKGFHALLVLVLSIGKINIKAIQRCQRT